MSQQTIPHGIWTRVGGTPVEAYQDTGVDIVLYVDPEDTEITVPVDSALNLRFRAALSRLSDEDEVIGASPDRRRARSRTATEHAPDPG